MDRFDSRVARNDTMVMGQVLRFFTILALAPLWNASQYRQTLYCILCTNGTFSIYI